MHPRPLVPHSTFADMDSLLAVATAQVGQFQSVVVKGSRFMQMERVVDAVVQQAADHKENNKKGEPHAA
jgi:UDP-N-acetylmuramoyl-tripeptide--D-alanyl-D-alanine ligase